MLKQEFTRFFALALTLTVSLSFSQAVNAQASDTASWNFQIEGAAAWQSFNDQAIPGKGGTRFDLADFSKGPFAAHRIYLGQRLDSRQEWRVLYAPLDIRLQGQFSKAILFQNSTFQPGVETSAKYKFNSYRASYIYHMDSLYGWNWAWGFTGKIRDAEVKLTQGNLSESKSNLGFVPLLHLQAEKSLSEDWNFRFDMDGLAAPQGRAFDIALLFEKKLNTDGVNFLAGYRTVEGGADNETVYNFAWIHYLTIGLRYQF